MTKKFQQTKISFSMLKNILLCSAIFIFAFELVCSSTDNGHSSSNEKKKDFSTLLSKVMMIFPTRTDIEILSIGTNGKKRIYRYVFMVSIIGIYCDIVRETSKNQQKDRISGYVSTTITSLAVAVLDKFDDIILASLIFVGFYELYSNICFIKDQLSDTINSQSGTINEYFFQQLLIQQKYNYLIF